MKKIVLLLLPAFLLSAGASAQTAQSVNRRSLEEMTKTLYTPEWRRLLDAETGVARANDLPPRETTPRVTGTSASLQTEKIGTSSNAYTILSNRQNQVFAHDGLNLVGWIHRQNIANFGGIPVTTSNGVLRVDFNTTEGGQGGWSLDRGPLNPIPYPNAARIRYPQAVPYLPSDASSFSDMRLIWFAPTTDGNGWGNYSWGITHDLPSMSQAAPDEPLDNGSFGFLSNFQDRQVFTAGGLSEGRQGEFWMVDNSFTNVGDGGRYNDSLLVFKGIPAEDGSGIAWTRHKAIQFRPRKDNNGSYTYSDLANMAFSPNGQWGWIVVGTDTDDPTNPDGRYHPVLWSSSDFGETWNGPIEVKLNLYPAVTSVLKDTIIVTEPGQETTLVSTGLPYVISSDITVDANGNPHVLTSMMCAAKANPTNDSLGYIQPAFAKALYDITTPDNGVTWCPRLITKLNAYSGQEPGTDVSYGNHVQVARTEDGNKIFYSWVDDVNADPTVDYDAMNPDLYDAALRITDGATTAPQVRSDEDVTFNGKVFFPVVSPTVLTKDDGTYAMPTVFLQFGNDGDIGPCDFYYIRNRTYADEDFVKPAADLAVVSVTAPAANLCNPTTEDVVFTVRNVGTSNLSEAVVTYSINGGDRIEATVDFGGALAPEAERSLTISGIDFSNAGTYVIDVFIQAVGDENCANNLGQRTVVSFSNTIFTVPSVSGCGFVTLNTGLSELAHTWTVNGVQQEETGSILNVTDVNATTVGVEVISPDCGGQSVSNSIAVEIFALPELTVPADTQQCADAGNVTLTATSDVDATVVWNRLNPANGNYESVSTNNTYEISNSGNYRVVVTNTTTQCRSEGDVSVRLWDVELTLASFEDEVCADDAFIDFGTANPPGTIYTVIASGTIIANAVPGDPSSEEVTYTNDTLFVGTQTFFNALVDYAPNPGTVTYRIIAQPPAPYDTCAVAEETIAFKRFAINNSTADFDASIELVNGGTETVDVSDDPSDVNVGEMSCADTLVLTNVSEADLSDLTGHFWQNLSISACRYLGNKGSFADPTGSSPISVVCDCNLITNERSLNIRMVSVAGACSDTVLLKMTVKPSDSRLELEWAQNMKVYPNPSKDVFNVSFDMDRPQDLILQVMDLRGVVVSETRYAGAASFNGQVDLTDRPAGMYMLRIQTKDDFFTTKLVKN